MGAALIPQSGECPPQHANPIVEQFNSANVFRCPEGVPEEYTPIGAITVGHRIEDTGPEGSVARGRRPADEVVHRGGW